MAANQPTSNDQGPSEREPVDALASRETHVATPTEIEEQDGVPQPAVLTREQEHWLAIEAKARLLACRTGSCGE